MSAQQTSAPVTILLVEDNPADVYLTKEALKQQALNLRIDVLEDGESALAYLRREGKYASVKIPDLVLLDLNLPRVGGQDILRVIRGTPELSNLCVVILSSSPQDVMGDFAAQASCYIEKPPTLAEFLAIGEKISQLLKKSALRPSTNTIALHH